MTAPASFKQADAARLIRAARVAGCAEDTIHLTVSPDGTLSLTVTRQADNDDAPGNSWDDA